MSVSHVARTRRGYYANRGVISERIRSLAPLLALAGQLATANAKPSQVVTQIANGFVFMEWTGSAWRERR